MAGIAASGVGFEPVGFGRCRVWHLLIDGIVAIRNSNTAQHRRMTRYRRGLSGCTPEDASAIARFSIWSAPDLVADREHIDCNQHFESSQTQRRVLSSSRFCFGLR